MWAALIGLGIAFILVEVALYVRRRMDDMFGE